LPARTVGAADNQECNATPTPAGSGADGDGGPTGVVISLHRQLASAEQLWSSPAGGPIGARHVRFAVGAVAVWLGGCLCGMRSHGECVPCGGAGLGRYRSVHCTVPSAVRVSVEPQLRACQSAESHGRPRGIGGPTPWTLDLFAWLYPVRTASPACRFAGACYAGAARWTGTGPAIDCWDPNVTSWLGDDSPRA